MRCLDGRRKDLPIHNEVNGSAIQDILADVDWRKREHLLRL
jgi:hypothetical protein